MGLDLRSDPITVKRVPNITNSGLFFTNSLQFAITIDCEIGRGLAASQPSSVAPRAAIAPARTDAAATSSRTSPPMRRHRHR